MIKNNNIDEEENKRKEQNLEKKVISGPNYQQMIPSTGVRIREEDQMKNGGLNFHNQFGKMSLKEYEQIRQHYLNKNKSSSNSNNIENNNENNNVPSHLEENRSSGHSKTTKLKGEDLNNNIASSKEQNPYDRNTLQCQRKNFYNWGEEIPFEDRSNFNNILRNNNNNEFRSQAGILNENLFKNRRFSDLRKEKNKISDNGVNIFNNFNGQIISNSKWGSVTNQKPFTNFTSSLKFKKDNEPNMRIRRKK